MRMWMVDPKIMCRKHLLGEHGELHKFLHNWRKQYRIDKRVFPVVQIEPLSYKQRHDALVKEMIARGYNHNSPLEQPDFSYLPTEHRNAKVSIKLSLNDLVNRCKDCGGKQ